ncbi:MAG: hypothetical protein KYQ20_01765 [Candidatus Nealsonbacteria bacterium]|nr:hypothetical protein [Candidatus Nealsonbacteria bacterium]
MNNILLFAVAILVLVGGLAFLYIKRKGKTESVKGPKEPEEPGTSSETPKN